MIYAKIIKENSSEEKLQVIIHFYGLRDECEKIKQEMKESHLHPISFLAVKGFVPKGDKTFVLHSQDKKID